MVNIKKMVSLSFFLCISLIIHYAESLLPPLIPIPGVKMGLANVITLILCFFYGKKEAFCVLMLRVLIASLFFGGVMPFLYSPAGGLSAFLVIALFMGNRKNIWSVSALSAFMHNAGQVALAVFLTKTPFLWWYLFPISVSGIISGIFTGLIASVITGNKNIQKLFFS